MHVVEVMSSETARDFRRRAEQLPFGDGRRTAAGDAEQVKRNDQSTRRDAADAAAFIDEVEACLAQHEAVRHTAFPRAFVDVRVSRYSVGDRYGMHTDAALMGRAGRSRRTDLSFTLFLSEPDEYDGGELRVASEAGAPGVKLPAGQLALYPTGVPHEVTTVQRGERLVVVGWIESWIADPGLREIIVKLGAVDSLLVEEGCGPVPRMLLSEVWEALVRYGAR